MKRNALIRIVIWSIVIVLLSSLLMGGLSFRVLNWNRNTSMKTFQTDGKADYEANAILDYRQIRSLEVEWASGSIVIQPMDISEILITEENADPSSEPMVWNIRDGKLSIRYCENPDRIFVFGMDLDAESKDLMIQVPLGWQCDSLEIEAASATAEVRDLTIREVEFDGASGSCLFHNCTVESLDLDTASGDVTFQGSLNKLDCDAASARILLELNNVPKKLDLDTASGDLDVTLPEGAGFSVSMDTMSGEFTSDFETISRNGKFIAGDGQCQIEVDSMSGNVNIRKGQ